MRKPVQLLICATVLLALFAAAPAAHAQATRTWVSGVGDDANPCSRTAPCKTFAGAISKTAPCGEIDVLDPGGFGALTITKCISIESEEFAGVLVSGTPAFIISAGASDNVTIRGITIEGIGTGTSAIRILTAGHVSIEHCWINNFVNEGVDINTSTNTTVSIKDTIIKNIAPGAGFPNGFGVYIHPTAGTPRVNLDNVRSEHNFGGLRLDAGTAVVRNSAFSDNTGNGVIAAGGAMDIEGSVISNNGFVSSGNGIQVNAGAALNLSTTGIFSNNLLCISIASGGTVVSFTNNRFRGNGNDTPGGGGTFTQVPQQ